MSPSRPIAPIVAGVDTAQQRVEATVAAMTEPQVHEASALPGWTRGHVLTHLARNADSQTAMLLGAQRGEVLDQYPGGDAQRNGDIEAGAGRSRAELAADLAGGHRRFLDAAGSMSDDAWDHLTRPRAGERPAWATVYARWREVEVHLVDLGLGPDSPSAGLSEPFVEVFLPGEEAQLAVRLPPSVAGSGAPPVLEGAAADRLLWLMGRPSGPVRLTVGGTEVAAGELVPWQQTMWHPTA